MLQEDHHSKQMNLEDELAEMEYHEEIVEKYKYEFDTESQVMMEIFEEQSRRERITK